MQSSPHTPTADIENPLYDWQPLSAYADAPLAPVRTWLEDEGSLTKQLVSLSQNHFRVELLSQEWVTLRSRALLRHFGPVAASHRFWSRKVLLVGHEQHWVAAHTLIPEHSFCSPMRQVIDLETKPLGEFLFSHPQLRRSEMDFTPAAEAGWGRRSLFFLFQKPVMVAEFFLPTLLNRLKTTNY